MMDDKRSFDGWRRLGPAVMKDLANDDPDGLRQVRAELDRLETLWIEAMRAQVGRPNRWNVRPARPYSHGEVAQALHVTRPAVSKRLARG